MTSHAQNNEDLFIHAYFGDLKGKGRYVDVGAHNGVQFSNTYLLEQNGWRGICIEPNIASYHQLVRNRPNSVCVQSACVSGFPEHSVTLYVPNGFGVLGTLSNKQTDGVAAILQTQPENITYTEQTVWAQRLDHILASNQIMTGFDLLSIDTEWTEPDVIAGSSLNLWQPRMLMVEANNTDERILVEAAIDRSAKDVKYHFAGRIAINYVWLRDGEDLKKARDLLRCHVLR